MLLLDLPEYHNKKSLIDLLATKKSEVVDPVLPWTVLEVKG